MYRVKDQAQFVAQAQAQSKGIGKSKVKGKGKGKDKGMSKVKVRQKAHLGTVQITTLDYATVTIRRRQQPIQAGKEARL